MYCGEETAAAISNSPFLKDVVWCSKCLPAVSIIMLSLQIFVCSPGQDDLVQKRE